MGRISAYGITVDVPAGWDGRIYRREADVGETTHAALHVASFPLPGRRGDFGSGAVEAMTADDVLLVLLEYHPDSAGAPLFQSSVPVSLDPAAFSGSSLQRPLAGQGGMQRFCTASGRAFCLYAVLGNLAARGRLVPRLDGVLATLSVAPAAADRPGASG
ncbi:MAG TPA: hypothetical protein VFH45_03425 [Acidimicrobiales bacterium]|nr:hypothetical protein [Acidimicrobiales bacterium]